MSIANHLLWFEPQTEADSEVAELALQHLVSDKVIYKWDKNSYLYAEYSLRWMVERFSVGMTFWNRARMLIAAPF